MGPLIVVAIFGIWIFRPASGMKQSEEEASASTWVSWRPVYAFVSLAIFAGLTLVRSPLGVPVRLYNSRLLANAAYVLSSESLARAAAQEGRLAESRGGDAN